MCKTLNSSGSGTFHTCRWKQEQEHHSHRQFVLDSFARIKDIVSQSGDWLHANTVVDWITTVNSPTDLKTVLIHSRWLDFAMQQPPVVGFDASQQYRSSVSANCSFICLLHFPRAILFRKYTNIYLFTFRTNTKWLRIQFVDVSNIKWINEYVI